MKNLKLYELIKDLEPVNEQEECDKKIMLKYIREFSDVLTRKNQMFHFTTSAWIVNSNKTKVLMVYHNIFNSWSWIGGHADGNSDLLEVVKKEIKEETGLDNVRLLDDKIFGLSIQIVKPHLKNNKFVSAHLHYDVQFLFEASEDNVLKIKEDENSDIAWIEIDEILDKVTEEHMKPIYGKLIDKVRNIERGK